MKSSIKNQTKSSENRLEESDVYMEKKRDTTTLDLGIGVIVFALVAQVIIFFVVEDLMYYSVGLWIGALVGIGMMLHMKRTIEDILDNMLEDADKYMKQKVMMRSAIILVVFGILGYLQIGSIFTALIGAMGLKISVYLQPYIYKVRIKLRKGGR